MKYKVNHKEISYQPEGTKSTGDDEVLLAHATDLTAGKPWSEQGFVVTRLFSDELFSQFRITAENLVRSLWQKALPVPDGFPLFRYHELATTPALHLAAVDQTKLLPVDAFPLPIKTIEDRIAEVCGTPLIAKNPFDGQSVFHFRVVRPNSGDNNPLHRDVWLDDYANCINLYLPIAGSNESSSLTLIPGSHRWPESRIVRTREGAILEGVKFNVPAVTEIKGDYEVIRPNPQRNEVLVFSPYLVHGGAVNLNQDQTRVSIELRLWKKN